MEQQIKSDELLENKDLRQQSLDRIDVLEQVKQILLIKGTEYATTQQVADYYDVTPEAIRSVVLRHKKELKENGLKSLKGKEILDVLVRCDVKQTKKAGFYLIDNTKIAYGYNSLFSKRTILNVGMLLEDSKIAKEIRSRLLDIVHDSERTVTKNGNTIVENVVEEVLDEQVLQKQLFDAFISGNNQQMLLVTTNIMGLKNKRINELEKETEELNKQNGKLKDTIDVIQTNSLVITECKASINRLVRLVGAKIYNNIFGLAWRDLYKTINYKLHINIKSREKKSKQSYLDTLTQDELQQVEKVARVWANENGVDVRKEIRIVKKL